MDTVYLNGNFMPADAARISPRDRGFRFGDGVFETIPFYDGKPYQWDFHLQRLARGLAALQIEVASSWRGIAEKLIKENQAQDGFIRISVSRGEGSKGYRPLPAITPTVFIELLPRVAPPASASLWLSGYRKPSVHSLPPFKLAAQGVTCTLALLEAEANGGDEALLLNESGHLCEAASGNLFWICGSELLTPALQTGCLNGAARHAIMRLHPAEETLAAPDALERADAVFITNSNWGILPVRALHPQGWQWPQEHPLIAQLQKDYIEDIKRETTM